MNVHTGFMHFIEACVLTSLLLAVDDLNITALGTVFYYY